MLSIVIFCSYSSKSHFQGRGLHGINAERIDEIGDQDNSVQK